MTAAAPDFPRLGRLVRAAAEERGWTPRRMCHASGLSKRDWQNLAGGRKVPALAYLRLCDFLSIDPVSLAPLAGTDASRSDLRSSSPLVDTSRPERPVPAFGGAILWPLVGIALAAKVYLPSGVAGGSDGAAPGSVRAAARAMHLSTATVSLALRGQKVDARSYLRICAFVGRHPHAFTPAGTAGVESIEARLEEIGRALGRVGRETSARLEEALAAAQAGLAAERSRIEETISSNLNALECVSPVKHGQAAGHAGGVPESGGGA